MPIDRRDFMKWCAATGSAAAIGLPTTSGADDLLRMFFPQLPPPKRLQGVLLTKEHSWHEWTLLTCLQGLVNRTEPRIFFLNDDYDELWLSYYAQTYGIDKTPPRPTRSWSSTRARSSDTLFMTMPCWIR